MSPPARAEESSAGAAVDAQTIGESIRRSGYVILPDFFDRAYIESLSDAIDGLFRFTGRNEFEGFQTQRVYSLVTQTRSADRFLEHPLLLEIIESLLGDRPILMRTQGIRLLPGAAAQRCHRDDVCIPIEHPGSTLSVSVMLAVSDFTEANGATRLIPASHLAAEPDEHLADAIVARMKPGSILIMVSQLVHGAGSNTTGETRTGVFANYCVPWLRTLDNHYIPLARHGLDGISARMLELLGYETSTHGGIVYGVVEGKHPMKFVEARRPEMGRGI